MDSEEQEMFRTIADYQFGQGAGSALFPSNGPTFVIRTTTGRPQQVLAGADSTTGTRIVSYGVDGRFTLGIEGGKRLHAAIGRPAVEVGDESVPFVADGKNAFAKFVRRVDDDIRPRDEVLVTHNGTVIAVGAAELPANGMRDFDTGVAVSVREGNKAESVK